MALEIPCGTPSLCGGVETDAVQRDQVAEEPLGGTAWLPLRPTCLPEAEEREPAPLSPFSLLALNSTCEALNLAGDALSLSFVLCEGRTFLSPSAFFSFFQGLVILEEVAKHFTSREWALVAPGPKAPRMEALLESLGPQGKLSPCSELMGSTGILPQPLAVAALRFYLQSLPWPCSPLLLFLLLTLGLSAPPSKDLSCIKGPAQQWC